mgnify:CR=1 FL=1
MAIQGPEELVRNVQETGRCIGCGACVDLCPYFKHYHGRTVQVFPCDLKTGRCFAHCPKIEVDLGELSRRLRGRAYEGLDLGTFRSLHASRAGAALSGDRYQGGGTVSALTAFALRSGAIEAAVLTDREGFWPAPRIVTTEDEVLACASSKFAAAPTLAAMNRAVRSGYRRLGVVGTPCQMTAVAQMKANPLDREDFFDPVALAVGLFCNWALDPRALLAFLSRRLDLSRVTGMDIPPPPADLLQVRLGDETQEIPLKEVRPFIPETCFFCPDLTSEWADVSVGMFEGRPGWNTLIVRSETGEEIVAEAEEAGYLEREPMPEESASHLAWAGRQKKERSFRKALRENAINTEDGYAVFRVPKEALEHLT